MFPQTNQLRIIHPAKLSSISEGGIKTFSDKNWKKLTSADFLVRNFKKCYSGIRKMIQVRNFDIHKGRVMGKEYEGEIKSFIFIILIQSTR